MSHADSADLRSQGIVVIPFMHSVALDPQRLEPHYHEFFQMFLLKGRAAVMHDFVEFDADGLTLVFMSPGQIHTAVPKDGLSGTTVSFTQEFFDHQTPPPSLLFQFPFFFAGETRPWVFVKPEDQAEISGAFAELQKEFDAALPGAEIILRALLQILLVRANRLYAEANPAAASRARQLLRQFQLMVEQRFREVQSVADYAKLLGITANHLNDLVREQTGHSAGDIIRERRLLDAKRLLLHSQLSVSEIGYHLGFQDPSYFARFFRRYAEATPAEFREQIREKYQPNAA